MIPYTTEEITEIVKKSELQKYPTSNLFAVGMNLHRAGNTDAATTAFKRGAESDGCVACLYKYVSMMMNPFPPINNMPLQLPWLLETSIRGHMKSIEKLIDMYTKAKPVAPYALVNFWYKMMVTIGYRCTLYTHTKRMTIKKNIANVCFVCCKMDLDDKKNLLKKCGKCKYYSYCSKDCQLIHWKEQNHMGECRQLKILRTCCKPHHVKEIRAEIIGGVDPKNILRLSNLRIDLGLDRPKKECEELMLRFDNNNNTNTINPHEYLIARTDGTVHIGSTPNVNEQEEAARLAEQELPRLAAEEQEHNRVEAELDLRGIPYCYKMI